MNQVNLKQKTIYNELLLSFTVYLACLLVRCVMRTLTWRPACPAHRDTWIRYIKRLIHSLRHYHSSCVLTSQLLLILVYLISKTIQPTSSRVGVAWLVRLCLYQLSYLFRVDLPCLLTLISNYSVWVSVMQLRRDFWDGNAFGLHNAWCKRLELELQASNNIK